MVRSNAIAARALATAALARCALRAAFGLDSVDAVAEVLGAGPWQAQRSTWERVETQAVSQSQMLAQAIVQ
jgi:hypothetical protein